MRERPLSKRCFEDLCDVIPGGVNSPVRAFCDLAITPLVAESGSGSHITDIDGNSYIDYCMSWGALIHGHTHPEVVEKAIQRLKMGSSFGATTNIEEKLARKITTLMPSCERVRLVSSGTEATMTACRLARGYTNRPLMIKFAGCYHGHADHFLVQAGSGVTRLKESSSSGIPKEMLASTYCLPFNDHDACNQLFDEIGSNLACVIIEPIAANMGVVPASKPFLELLRRRTKECGALLIFDEVISGFRVALGGAQEKYGITPDLSCFGKIMGGGFPAAGFGGKKEIMDVLAPQGSVYQAGTLSGNPVAMEAGLKALELCQAPGFYDTLNAKARIIIDPVREYIKKHDLPFCINSVDSLFTLFCGVKEVNNQADAKKQDNELFNKLFYYMFEHGVYMPPGPYEGWFVSMAHSQDELEKTRDLLLQWLRI
ncbi:MAG: glutamate-1-semialdehyde 2,1-aminomutase [Verrucomicrobia bacterium]|nr:glutamate-1-semialdehyde 2,1-aminomutase [Verrucomicrobiota bacterium]MBS0637779.1 glutamate-1-semialdehyde 2,1-aminomutase [Verrucomicrobiota bacterium]